MFVLACWGVWAILRACGAVRACESGEGRRTKEYIEERDARLYGSALLSSFVVSLSFSRCSLVNYNAAPFVSSGCLRRGDGVGGGGERRYVRERRGHLVDPDDEAV